MAYTIGHAPKGWKNVSTAEVPNAREAWNLVQALQASDKEIRYIKAPSGGEIGWRELQIYAEQEGKK